MNGPGVSFDLPEGADTILAAGQPLPQEDTRRGHSAFGARGTRGRLFPLFMFSVAGANGLRGGGEGR